MKENIEGVKCFVCDKEPKYTCPRCSIHYCCLACYRHEKHSNCSEEFYKEQVVEELKNMKGSPRSKRKIMETLQRQYAENSGDKDIGSRLENVHLDDVDVVWEKLTAHEKFMFQERVRTGNLDFLKIWEPWWERNQHSKSTPPIICDLPKLEALLKNKKPSETLKYNVLELLLAYTSVMRIFNGDMFDSPAEAAELLYALSKVLQRQDYVYDNVELCLTSFVQSMEEQCTVEIGSAVETCLRDLQVVLGKEQYMCRALCDLHNKLKKLIKMLKHKKEALHLVNKLKKTVRKVFFFIVYSKDCEINIKMTTSQVIAFSERIISERREFQEEKVDIESQLNNLKPDKPPLIEEL